MNRVESVLLLVNPDVADCARAADSLEKEMRVAGFHVTRDAGNFNPEKTDLAVLLGGDGYLMEIIHALDFPSIGFFGVNFGTVGFLMNSRACLGVLAETIRKRRFRSETHPVLECSIRMRSGEDLTEYAFNDVVLERMSGQGIRFTAIIDEVEFNRFSGDGVVIATPGGSTAYNLAAGGPVVHPGISALVITPLYPHRAAPFHSLEFCLVLPLHRTVRIVGDDVTKRPIRVLTDGRSVDDIEGIEVRDSGRRIQLLRTEDHSFVGTLAKTFIGKPEMRD